MCWQDLPMILRERQHYSRSLGGANVPFGLRVRQKAQDEDVASFHDHEETGEKDAKSCRWCCYCVSTVSVLLCLSFFKLTFIGIKQLEEIMCALLSANL